jgi:hypothetical protein
VTVSGISPVAAESDTQVSAHIDWSGVNLTTNTSLSQTIKPLNVPALSVGQVDWSINMGNTEQALWPSFALSNTGRAMFAFYDVPAASKVENVGNASCNLQAGNAFQAANTWRSTCSAPLMPIAGESYEFVVKPLKINGSQWWAGSVTIGSTGEVIPLGRLENNPSQSTLNGSQNMRGFNQISFYKQSLPPCSQIPNFSAIIGPLKTSTGSQPIVSGKRISQNCPDLSGIDSFSLGSKIDLAKSLIDTEFVIKKIVFRLVFLFFSFLFYFFVFLVSLALGLCLTKTLAPIIVS